MKIYSIKQRFYILSWSIISLFTITSVLSCKNPAEDVKIAVNSKIFKSQSVLIFKNANQAEADPNDVTVTFTGPGANLVRTTSGGKVFKTTNGLLNFVLDKAANPSPSSPVQVTAVISAAGFAPNYIDISIIGSEDGNFYTAFLQSYAKPSNGSAAIVTSQTLQNGLNTTPINIATAPNASQPTSTSLSIPVNTAFKGASGNNISASQLETKIIYTAPDQNGVINHIAGDGNITQVLNENGQLGNTKVKIKPLALASINMTAGTTAVKSFSKPLVWETELPSGRINPATKTAYKVGDVLSSYSLNESTGVWTKEENAVVVQKGNKLVAKKEITHLSAHIIGEETTTITFNVEIKNSSEIGGKFLIKGMGINKTVNININSKFSVSTSFTIDVVPGSKENLTIEALDALNYANSSITKSYNVNELNGKTITESFTAKTNMVYGQLNINVECTDSQLLLKPAYSVKVKNLKNNISSVIFLDVNDKGTDFVEMMGYANIYALDANSEYELSIDYLGKPYKVKFTTDLHYIKVDKVEQNEIRFFTIKTLVDVNKVKKPLTMFFVNVKTNCK